MLKITRSILYSVLLIIYSAFMGDAMAETNEYSWHYWNNADFNYDGIIDNIDLAVFSEDWLSQNGNQTYQNNQFGPGTDIDGDGIVNLTDFRLFTDNWLVETDYIEFPDKEGLMIAWTERSIYEPTDSFYPGTEVDVFIYNLSTHDKGFIGTEYWMDNVTMKVGTGQGLTSAYEGNHPPGDWGVDASDPNEIKFFTTTPGYMNKQGMFKQYKLIANDPTKTLDPNDFGFKIDTLNAEATSGDGKTFAPLKIYLPIEINP